MQSFLCLQHVIMRLVLVCAGMGVFSFARYDDNFYSRSYAGTLRRSIKPKQGDYSVFDGYYTPPITSTLLLRSCKVPQPAYWHFSGILMTNQSPRQPFVCLVSLQTMTHEIGHMFGIKHCQWLNCVMQGSNHLEESDRRPLDFCPICLRKMQSAVGFKIAERYKVQGTLHIKRYFTLKQKLLVFKV